MNARKLILLVLVVLLTIQGCTSQLRCLDGGGAARPSFLTQADHEGSGGLQQTRHGDGVRVAVYAAVGIIIVAAFVVDLFILPYSCYHRRHYFPLCTGLIHWCH